MGNNKTIAAVFLMLLPFLTTKAQNTECGKITDTVLYVTVDVRSTQAYPIVMSGVGKEKLNGTLSISNVDSFLGSFYRKYKYVPDPLEGYKKMLPFCSGDSVSNKIHPDQDRNDIAIFIGKSSGLALHEKIKLQTGETVFVSMVKIGGVFWKVDSHSPGLKASSNEYPLSRIPEISDCYVPYRIGFYQKPKFSDW